jgi:hypothetical protein
MAKKLVTCTARGPRGVNVYANGKDDKNGVESVILNPNESRELALVDEDHPVLQGMIANREIVIGEADLEPLSEEEEQERQEQVYLNDPMFRATQEAASAAARTPGLADPLPREKSTRERPVSARAAPRGGRKARGDGDE